MNPESKTKLIKNFLILLHLIVPSLFSATIVGFTEYLVYPYIIEYMADVDIQMLYVSLPVMAAFLIFLATNAVASAQEKRNIMETAINADDLETFVRHADKQIGFAIECTLGLMALLIIVELLITPWPNMTTGLVAGSSVSFALVLTRQLGWIRDNPLEGPDEYEYLSEQQKEKFVTAALTQQIDNKKPYRRVRRKK